MEFCDLSKQYQRIQNLIDANIKKVLTHTKYIMGPEVSELEEKLATFVGVKHCITVASGTDALLMSMMALNIGPGDEVITTPFTFFATVETILMLGAVPVFVDIDPRTCNIDADLIEEKITERTRMILPVSLYGQCADFDRIGSIANARGISVVEDAAQSFGATYRQQRSCSLSTMACTSFFPSKPLGGYGDGGACFTNDDALANSLKEIRLHGQKERYTHYRIGLCGRLDTIQAAILLAKLTVFEDEIVRRQKIAAEYDKRLYDFCQTPWVAPHQTSVYAQYTIQTKNRNQWVAKLKEEGIPTAIHYPKPMTQQPCLFHMEWPRFPVTETACEQVLSLPMHPYLEIHEIEKIAEVIATLSSI